MQPHIPQPYPPPDLGRGPSPTTHLQPPSQPSPSFLVIGLFALRLAKQLIQGLDPYPEQETDLVWLTNFLSAYHDDYALAKITGPRKDDYLIKYQSLVSRMKRQPRYPMRFMQMNPDRSAQLQEPGRREMDDAERLAVIDFCDAAGEWGSVVPIPAREADRMIELADRRRIAVLN